MPNWLGAALSYLAVVGAGVALALQQVLNTRLRVELASPWWAGFVSYLLGLMAMIAVVCLLGEARPGAAVLARVSTTSWAGVLFGALFVGTAIVMVPRLGVATVLGLVVVGQMVGSMVFDQVGLLGLAQQPITPSRVVGGLLLVVGVVCIRS